MESAELKTNKRIRHCFPRKEVYHRFIHSPERAYYSGSHGVLAVGNIIRINTGVCSNQLSWEQVKENEYYHCLYTFGIIDRNRKRILISTKYPDHTWDLRTAMPDDYDIFYTDGDIPNLNILNNDEELYKIHAKYAVKKFMESLSPFYCVLNDWNKVLHIDVDSVFYKEKDYQNYHCDCYYSDINCLNNFVKRFNIKQYSWYKDVIVPKIKLYKNYWESYEVEGKSLKAILENKVFNKKEKLLLKQKWVYTKDCYGKGIPFKDVVKYWHKTVTAKEAREYCVKHSIFAEHDIFKVDGQAWITYISSAVNAQKKNDEAYIQKQLEISRQNKAKAEEEYEKLYGEGLDVKRWREGTKIGQAPTVSYRAYERVGYRHEYRWVTRYIGQYRGFHFNNTQLRLRGDTIYTSKGASVSIHEGRQMFKLFLNTIARYPKCFDFHYKDNNIKCGLYNLRYIQYKDKTTDMSKQFLGRKDWCIQIGCHSLWLEEIIEFIEYYNLEKDFGLVKGYNGNYNVYATIKNYSAV